MMVRSVGCCPKRDFLLRDNPNWSLDVTDRPVTVRENAAAPTGLGEHRTCFFESTKASVLIWNHGRGAVQYLYDAIR